MILFRLLGWLFLAAGAFSLALDVLQFSRDSVWRFAPVGEVWTNYTPSTLAWVRDTLQHHAPQMVDQALVPFLMWPAALGLGGIGIVLLLIGSIGRRR